MAEKHEPESKEERTDDLELPEEVAEDVKGGKNLPQKGVGDKFSKIKIN
jgi:hypothetical protein